MIFGEAALLPTSAAAADSLAAYCTPTSAAYCTPTSDSSAAGGEQHCVSPGSRALVATRQLSAGRVLCRPAALGGGPNAVLLPMLASPAQGGGINKGHVKDLCRAC